MNSRALTAGAAIGYTIRPETPEDAEAIAALTKAAFAPVSFSDGAEYLAPGRMREEGDLTLSLGAIIGHATPRIFVQYMAFSNETPVGEVTFVKGLEPE